MIPECFRLPLSLSETAFKLIEIPSRDTMLSGFEILDIVELEKAAINNCGEGRKEQGRFTQTGGPGWLTKER
jgi:hypothetical protein